jgi:hypothetical protein
VSTFSDALCVNATQSFLVPSNDAAELCVPTTKRSFALINATTRDAPTVSLACDADCRSCAPASPLLDHALPVANASHVGACLTTVAGLNAAAAHAVRARTIDTTSEFRYSVFADSQCQHSLGVDDAILPSGQCVALSGTQSFGFLAKVGGQDGNAFVGGLACADDQCNRCKLHLSGAVGACVASGRGFFVRVAVRADDDIDMGADWDGHVGEFHSDEL